MELAELKALAEKVTPGPWHWDSDPVKGDPLDRTRFRVVTKGRTITQCYYSSGDDMAQHEAAYIAAANPAAILELIAQLEDARTQMERQKDEWLSWEAKRRDLEKAAAQLEDAQGEIRALRATEAGLRERVKELESALKGVVDLCDDPSGFMVDELNAAARALLEKKE